MTPLLDMTWGTPLRKIVTSTCAMIAAVFSVIVGFQPAWSALGLPVPATKTYVDGKVTPIITAQAATTKAIYQLTLVQLQAQLRQAQMDEARAPSPSLEALIANLQAQIVDLQNRIAGMP